VVSYGALIFMIVFVEAEHNCTRFLTFLLGVGVPIAGWIWIGTTRGVPFKEIGSEDYVVETVRQSNGTAVQIISLDAVNKVNVTEKFNMTFPEGTKIRRHRLDRRINGLQFDEAADVSLEPILPPTTQPGGK
jgi:hypothetical protein